MASPPTPPLNTTSPPPPAPSPPTFAPPPSIPSPPPPELTPPPPTITPPPPPDQTSAAPPPPTITPPPPTPSGSADTSPPPPPSSSSLPSPPSPPSSPSNFSPPSLSLTPPPPPSSSSLTITSGVIIGIAISGVVVLLVLGLLCFCCTKKKRRRRNDHGNEQYYLPPPVPAPKDNAYHGGAQHWQQSNPPQAEQYMMPKPPPPVARPPPSPDHPPTLPSPVFVSGSGGSGSNYSGSEGPLPPPSSGTEFSFSKNSFTYEELARATDGFSDDYILGQGGFGYVYKGVLPNGKEVAVKSLRAGSIQGDREFQAEVEIISRVHHKHLVSLVGYCISGSERMLVYDFVPNKTLQFHLHGKGQPTMDWRTRLKIALGSAKGLAYLHEDCHPKIIHRDIKGANILLDFKFEAQVADFGLAKFSSDLNTHISTRVMGTFGYLAPEYASSGKLTAKSDVFSFGVMLLELITGRRAFDTTNSYMDDCLVDWARPFLIKALENENFDSLVDPQLQKSYNHSEMARMVACAAACVRHSARRRPRMSQVVRVLEGGVSLSDLNDGITPGHSSAYGSSDYDTSQYKDEMNRFRQIGLVDHVSSEYGGTTSEYGLNLSGSSSEAQTTREMEMGRVHRESLVFSGGSTTEPEPATGETTETEIAKKDS